MRQARINGSRWRDMGEVTIKQAAERFANRFLADEWGYSKPATIDVRDTDNPHHIYEEPVEYQPGRYVATGLRGGE